jgi:hypothetical protein
MDRRFGYCVIAGLAIGAVWGLLWGSAGGNALRGIELGALAGVAIGWFAGAAVLQNGIANAPRDQLPTSAKQAMRAEADFAHQGATGQMKKEGRNLVIFLLATFVWTWAFYTP